MHINANISVRRNTTQYYLGSIPNLLCLQLLVSPVPSVKTQSHTICHVTQCHLATRAMELISTPCQCVFGQGIASPQSHQNVWCKKSGNECQFESVGTTNVRIIPPQILYCHENSQQGHVETERNICYCRLAGLYI